MKQVTVLIISLVFLSAMGSIGVALEVDPRVETTYYLRIDPVYEEQVLKKTPGPFDPEFEGYITTYIYPPSYPDKKRSESWQTVLEEDISGTVYGYSIDIRSNSDTRIKLEWILNRGEDEIILATEYINNPATDFFNVTLVSGKVKGIDPVSGEGDILLFKITHVSGATPVEIYFESAPTGIIGCSYITIPKYPGKIIFYNYPNPAKGINETVFRCYLLYDSDISIEIYNLNYEKIATLNGSGIGERYGEIKWDISNIPGGVYICAFKTSKETLTQKAMIIK